MIRDEATRRQIEAAQPDRSTWLSANAGSGKTRVLTDRVARLLLDGVNPQNILCLTYTKAAASEMQNRLFERLGEWAMMPDPDLRKALDTLGCEGMTDPDLLRRARRLFASAIETPGGLKIQTIHSFCAMLLRRFPLEAGVSPQFTEIDERSAALLQRDTLEKLCDGDTAPVVNAMAAQLSGEGFEEILPQILRWQDHFRHPFDKKTTRTVLGNDTPGDTETVLNAVFLGGEVALFERLIPALAASSSNDVKAAEKLAQIVSPGIDALPILEDVFLYGSNAQNPFLAKLGSFPTRKCAAGLADIIPQLEALMLRVQDARERRLALLTYERSKVMHDFAYAFLSAYDVAKQHFGWLDFDDLIARAYGLLTNPAVAAWVLFRLDGGVDHILVDEAQDTSPLQWKVIERLAQEFTSGEGARADITRTIFVVGDKKQSIYSFQGADPREFDRMRQEFAVRINAGEKPLQDLQMAFSFRSSQAILSAVDATFAGAEASGFTPGQDHKAFHQDMPGRVDLWPVTEPAAPLEEPDWHDPVDYPAANDPDVELADRVANYLRDLIATHHPIPDQKEPDGTYSYRPVRPGDILILVQRRGLLFQELISACKRVGLPVAGADRLKVAGELAVRDIGALLSFLATPQDNLSLAAALRSPLFNWDEAQLFDLSHRRSQPYLWQVLRERANEWPETMAILQDLRNHADYLRPYEMIERILTRHGGRKRLLGRLGTEAEDGIDALLSQAMVYEQKSVDSLTGFLIWLQTDDMVVKRQMDEAGDQIRVMTVHGAKGLEAPVVILPETSRRTIRQTDQVIPVADQILWKNIKAETPSVIAHALGDVDRAARAERDRLLYVAMTRAKTWLIVAASKDIGKEPADSWYGQVQAGLQHIQAQSVEHPTGQGLRFEQGAWEEVALQGAPVDTPKVPLLLPAFFEQTARTPEALPLMLTPSDLGGDKTLPGQINEDSETALQRGRQIHKLLEFLPTIPRNQWDNVAKRILTSGTDTVDDDNLTSMLSEICHLLDAPELQHLFAADALAEVPISCTLPSLQNRRIHGVIDRLIIDQGTVWAIDFKSNVIVPETPQDVPEGILRQMGAYAEALVQVYPDRQIRIALLWTRTGQLMELSHELVIAALKRTPLP